MKKEQIDLLTFVIGLADDSLIMGQRLSEWCYHAPYLEEDLALTNVALDYLGRANNLYEYASEIDSQKRSVDDFALRRDTREFANLLIHELPIGDFAFTSGRQFLLDVFYSEYLKALCSSTDERVSLVAQKAEKETRYHLRRSKEWMLRLGDGTEESHARMQQAIDQLWGYLPELFAMTPEEERLQASGVSVDRTTIKLAWDAQVNDVLAAATLSRPADSWAVHGGRDGIHTEHHLPMLAEMQFLQRAYPGQEW